MENTDKIFLGNAQGLVAKVLSSKTGDKIVPEDVFTVWFSKTLQNAKGMFSTDAVDGFYFEVTYNGDKKEFYVDTYTKDSNGVFTIL